MLFELFSETSVLKCHSRALLAQESTKSWRWFMLLVVLTASTTVGSPLAGSKRDTWMIYLPKLGLAYDEGISWINAAFTHFLAIATLSFVLHGI